MAVIIRIESTSGSVRSFTLQDGQKLPPIALVAGDKVSMVDQNSPGIELVMDGDNVSVNWSGGETATSFQNLALYLQQESGSLISVEDQDSGTTKQIATLEELLAGFSTAAGGQAGDTGAGGGLTNNGLIDEQGLEAGGGSPLDVNGGLTAGGLVDLLQGLALEEGTDVNSAPVFAAADDELGKDVGVVEELTDEAADETADISTSGTLAFADADTGDVHTVSVVAPAGSEGYVGSLTAEISDPATGDGTGAVTWTFTVDNELVDYLAAGESLVQTYDIVLSDGAGGFDTETVTVTIAGTNDAPAISSGVVAGSVTEIADLAEGENETVLGASGTLSFDDVDLSNGHTVDVTPSAAGYLGSLTASVSDVATGAGDGAIAWDFSVADSATDYLAAGQTLVQSYTVTVADGHGGSDTQTVTITITGSNDAPVITSANSADSGVTEDCGSDHTASGSLAASDDDASDTLTWSIADADQGRYGTAIVAGDGTWTYTLTDASVQALAAGESWTDTFAVTVSDGHGGTDTQDVTVTITGTNDAPVIGALTGNRNVFEIADGAVGETTAAVTTGGTIAFADADLSDVHSVSVLPEGEGYLGTLTAAIGDLANGDGAGSVDWSFSVPDGLLDHLKAGETLIQRYVVEVADAEGEVANKLVAITITGTNDAPVADYDYVVTNIFNAPVAIPIADLLLNDSDVDGDPLAIIGAACDPAIGTASVDPDTGAIIFTPNGALPDGMHITVNYTLADGQGGETTGSIALTVDKGTINAISGLNQIVIAGGGNDTANAGDGSDILYGQSGNDTLRGDAGNDRIAGGAGNDKLHGGEGDDQFDGGEGTDTADYGDAQSAVVVDLAAGTASGEGEDTLANIENVTGSDHDDTITGDDNANVLRGGAGADGLNGGAGNDTLYIDALDTVDGGVGRDTARVEGPDGVTLAFGNSIEVAFGGAGDDNFSYDGGSANVTYHGDGGNDVLTGGSGGDTLRGDEGDDVLDGGAGNDKLYGGEGNDTLQGGAGRDDLSGENGDDLLIVDGQDRTISGGDGHDTAEYEVSVHGATLTLENSIEQTAGTAGDDDFSYAGGTQSVLYSGGAGNDTLAGGEADDILEGEAGDDRLIGGAGNDALSGGDGFDELEGGEGDDELTGGEGDDFLDGGDGADVLEGEGGSDALFGGEGDDFLEGQGGNDTLFGDAGSDVLEGGAGDDTLYGGNGSDAPVVEITLAAAGEDDDVLGGGDGNDTLFGEGGSDTLYGDAGDDVLDGGSGNDRLEGGADSDILDGGAGGDTLLGGAGNDTLQGGAGADALLGDDGDDLLVIDAEDATIDGGAGHDTAEYEASVLGATLTVENSIERTAGTDGDDDFSYAGGTAAVDYNGGLGNDTLTGGDADDFLGGDEGSDRLIGGAGNDVLDGGASADELEGGEGDDLLTGGAGADFLDGGEGDDILEGQAGRDDLFGGAGNDFLSGGAADDLLDGGAGNDTLFGDGGDDVVEGGIGDDTVYGGAGNDVLGGDGAAHQEAAPGETYNDTLYGEGGNDTLYGDAGDDDLFGGTGSDSLVGGAGIDWLRGGDGDDVLFGGAGNDTFHVDSDDIRSGGTRYTDTIRDFGHGDTLDLRDVVDWLANDNGSVPAANELHFEQHGEDVWVVTTNGRGGSSSFPADETIVVIEEQTTANLTLDENGNVTANT